MNTANTRNMMTRPPVPGEVWKFDCFEAHCIFMELERIKPFAPENDELIATWRSILELEVKKFKLRKVQEVVTYTAVKPTDGDCAFFTALIAEARAHLWALPEEFSDGTVFVLPCDHLPAEHETILRGWLERELELPKKFVSSREAIEKLPLEQKIFGPPIVSAKDAERMIQEELTKIKSEKLSSKDEELILQVKELNNWSLQEAEDFFWSMRENTIREGVAIGMRVI